MDEFDIALIVVGIVFLIGLFGLIRKIRMSFRATALLKKLFSFVGSVLVVVAILFHFDIYLRGYWTTKIFIWFFILIASLLFTFGNRNALGKAVKVITGITFCFPVASVLWLFIVPFMGPVLTLTIWGHILGNKDDVLYDDNEIRLQRVFKGALGSSGPPYYFKKSGILEFSKGALSVNFYENPDSLKVDKTKDTIIIYFYHNSKDDAINPVSFKFKR